MDSSANELKKFLDRKDFTLGLKIRTDRSIIPTCGTYETLHSWPSNADEKQLLMKLIKAQIIFRKEFVNFNPLLPKNSHPRGFRTYVKDRANIIKQRSEWLFRGLTLTFQIWLDNLGPDAQNLMKVSIFKLNNYNFFWILERSCFRSISIAPDGHEQGLEEF